MRWGKIFIVAIAYMSRDALIIEINTYHWDELKNLSMPANDAEAILQRLQRDSNFHVTRLPDFINGFEDNVHQVVQSRAATFK